MLVSNLFRPECFLLVIILPAPPLIWHLLTRSKYNTVRNVISQIAGEPQIVMFRFPMTTIKYQPSEKWWSNRRRFHQPFVTGACEKVFTLLFPSYLQQLQQGNFCPIGCVNVSRYNLQHFPKFTLFYRMPTRRKRRHPTKRLQRSRKKK